MIETTILLTQILLVVWIASGLLGIVRAIISAMTDYQEYKEWKK
jgi:hypothetical protein